MVDEKTVKYKRTEEKEGSEDICLKSLRNFRVVIFGSARIERGDEHWKLIYDLAKRIAEEGMDLVTGGGPGLMNAASEGHFAGDDKKTAQSIGLQIILPKAQKDARHLDIIKDFSRFSTRLDTFVEFGNVIVVASGGIGTMLEFFYTWQLMQVKMIREIPIILLGNMWQDFVHWIKKWPLKKKLLGQEDIDLLFLVNNNEDVLTIIKKAYEEFKTRQSSS